MQDLDLSGKRVFIRADLNVPLDDSGNIADDTRIRASLPGIRGAAEAGAAVMVTSHLGRPKEGELRLSAPDANCAQICNTMWNMALIYTKHGNIPKGIALLESTLYDLKQAPRQWYKRFDS